MKYRITHFWVNAFGVEDGTIVFDDTNASCTGTGQVAACVKTDITKTLYDVCFASPAGCSADGLHVGRLFDEVFETVEDTATSGRNTAMNTALVDRFAGDASVSINILVANGLGVCVGDPGHFTFASAHVWSWHINAWPNETLLRQFQCEATCDLLQFMNGVFFWIQFQASLGTAEWHIDTSCGNENKSKISILSIHCGLRVDK